MGVTSPFFSSPWVVFTSAVVFRLALLAYGKWQDANSPVKYTDIDYLVFTDAARFTAWGRSPYDRATYRYTPLLAWILWPTTWPGLWFEFGKVVFAAGDVVTGWLLYRILRDQQGMDVERAMKFSSIWLLNPMVANISTRGSSEGLLAVIVVALLWATLNKRFRLAGCLLGFGVHFKIYPFIYAMSIFWWLGENGELRKLLSGDFKNFLNWERFQFVAFSLVTFSNLNGLMYSIYGMPFVEHTFLYHVIRIDHRHNFSVYNTLLHMNAATGSSGFKVESLAFLPQLFLSVVALPLLLAKIDLPSTMLAQTLAFVAFNKVCTSQYFLWYMVFLPCYLPTSSLLMRSKFGIIALLLWVLGQAVWLQQGFQLEFLGKSTFTPGLWIAGLGFFGINCWLLGVVVDDTRAKGAALVDNGPEPKKLR